MGLVLLVVLMFLQTLNPKPHLRNESSASSSVAQGFMV